MKKIFNTAKVQEQLKEKLDNANSFNEKMRIAVKFEDSLIEKGIIDSYNDRTKYFKIACELVNVYSRIYSAAEYIERHGTKYERNIYTQNSAITTCKKVRARIGEQLRKEHPELVRTCSVCGETKHISEFYNNGYYERNGEEVKKCKKCDSERERQRRQNNFVKIQPKETVKKETPAITQIKNADDSEHDIAKYAVSEIIVNVRSKKNEVNNLFLGWADTLKTISKHDRELIAIELDSLISIAKTLKKGIS